MNNIVKPHVLSPFQPQAKTPHVIDVRKENHPVHAEIKKLCGIPYNIEVSFTEDAETLNLFSHIPGLIAVKCILKKDGQVIAIGRGCSVFSRMNKYLERTINSAISGSFLSATATASKILESFRVEGQADQEEELATEKQKSFLETLISEKISAPAERAKWLKELSQGMTRDEASGRISALLDPK